MAHPYVCHQFKYANDLIGIVFYFFVIVGAVYSQKTAAKMRPSVHCCESDPVEKTLSRQYECQTI
ncbi:hypothetical protein LHGZ1_1034 [Laribacter hongkongensis]|uniref:Uncharacterized protein n=1 Tax=Laribacter hongkongensis TaxID=168471 RepID=A0A248LH69_9NEIS|nr:hypothetical protein LHGZ1_1034 [Laribacter hongkongensis]